MERLRDQMRNEALQPYDIRAAIVAIQDRAWGKPSVAPLPTDDDGAIRIVGGLPDDA